jgi:hypothetical protein
MYVYGWVLFIKISEFTPKSNEITWRAWAPFVGVPKLENGDQCDDISIEETEIVVYIVALS